MRIRLVCRTPRWPAMCSLFLPHCRFCRLLKSIGCRRTGGARLAHLFLRAFSNALALGVDVGVEALSHFLSPFRHLPAALHFAGVGHPGQVLNPPFILSFAFFCIRSYMFCSYSPSSGRLRSRRARTKPARCAPALRCKVSVSSLNCPRRRSSSALL
jgi:hypothetical protein